MSTDRQQFSIDNQLQVISAYAHLRGATIVRTYSDGSRSGLTVQGRDAFRQLISEVEQGRADFELILVYDVSRWGRFQNVDEGAHYEYLCRKRGVSIEYCTDGFENDGSMLATLIKGVRRSIAAEYSRELSARISRSQLRLAALGLYLGGTPELGLRRMLVDRNGTPKLLLKQGDRKCLQDDRVILVPGPSEEIEAVRETFSLFASGGVSTRRIALLLNARGLRTTRGNPWKNQNVLHLLRCERYVGSYLYNRTSVKLRTDRIANPPSRWVRADDAFEPIIEPELFATAKARLDNAGAISDRHLLDHLTAVWCVAGYLSCASMKQIPHTPVPHTYQDRFGSLAEAFRLLGYQRSRTYRDKSHAPLQRQLDRALICDACASVRANGGTVAIVSDASVLRIDEMTTVVTAVLPFGKKKTGRAGWWMHFNLFTQADLALVTRLTKKNDRALDHHLLPLPVFSGPSYRFTDQNVTRLSAYRLPSIAGFYDACRGLAGRLACR